jgi:hypothetical protein
MAWARLKLIEKQGEDVFASRDMHASTVHYSNTGSLQGEKSIQAIGAREQQQVQSREGHACKPQQLFSSEQLRHGMSRLITYPQLC